MKQQNRVMLGVIVVALFSGMAFFQSGTGGSVVSPQPDPQAEQGAITPPTLEELQARVGNATSGGLPDTAPIEVPMPPGSSAGNTEPRGRWWDDLD